MGKFLFSGWLAQRRAALGISMAALGKQMGEALGRHEFTQGYINDMEKGRRLPTEETVMAAATVFNVDASWLQALVDIERLGEERVRAIAAIASSTHPPSPHPPIPPITSPASYTADEAITGPGARPLTDAERTVIRQMERVASLRDRGLHPGASLWLEPPGRRLRGLRELLAEDGDKTEGEKIG